MTREDIDITVDNYMLTIKGEKKLADEVKEEQFHRIERRYGRSAARSRCRRPWTRRRSRRTIKERRADRQAPAARGSQAAADQGRRRRVTGDAQRRDRGRGRSFPGPMPALPAAEEAYVLRFIHCMDDVTSRKTNSPRTASQPESDAPLIPTEPVPPIESRFLLCRRRGAAGEAAAQRRRLRILSEEKGRCRRKRNGWRWKRSARTRDV